MKIEDFTLDLIAQLFNPDQLIRETAAWALLQIDTQLYHSNSIRLGDEIKRSLDAAILDRGVDTSILLYDKVLFLQRIKLFEGLAGITLSYVADMSRNVFLKKDQSLPLNTDQDKDFLLVYNGHIQYFEFGQKVSDFYQGQFLGEQLSESGKLNLHSIVAKEETILLKFNKDEFYELLSDQVKLADKILEYI